MMLCNVTAMFSHVVAAVILDLDPVHTPTFNPLAREPSWPIPPSLFEQRQTRNILLLLYPAVGFSVESSDCVSIGAWRCRWWPWQAADGLWWTNTRLELNGDGGERGGGQGMKNGPAFSDAWHRRGGSLSQKRRGRLRGVWLSPPGWQIALWVLWEEPKRMR